MRHLLVGITGICVLGWYVNTYFPENTSRLVWFFLILVASLYFLSLAAFKIPRRAVLITLGVFLWLLLRLIGLRDFYYPLLLVPILISLEMLFQRR